MTMLNKVMAEHARPGMIIISDVDGVHTTREGGVVSLEAIDGRALFCIEMGLEALHLVPAKGDASKVEAVLGGFADRKVWELYRFHTPDGQALQNLLKQGNSVEIVSGRKAAPVADRFGNTLKYDNGSSVVRPQVSLGIKEKLPWALEREFDLQNCIFIGDGAQDAPLMEAIHNAGGISVATADAEDEAIAAATCVTSKNGGEGAFAEMVHYYLKAAST